MSNPIVVEVIRGDRVESFHRGAGAVVDADGRVALAFGVLLDSNEAREAVQEAFLRLHQAAPTWEPRAAVGTWLYRDCWQFLWSILARLSERVGRLEGDPCHSLP